MQPVWFLILTASRRCVSTPLWCGIAFPKLFSSSLLGERFRSAVLCTISDVCVKELLDTFHEMLKLSPALDNWFKLHCSYQNAHCMLVTVYFTKVCTLQSSIENVFCSPNVRQLRSVGVLRAYQEKWSVCVLLTMTVLAWKDLWGGDCKNLLKYFAKYAKIFHKWLQSCSNRSDVFF